MKRTLLALTTLPLILFTLNMSSPAANASPVNPCKTIPGANRVLNCKGPHKIGEALVNGKLKTYYAYQIRPYVNFDYCIDNTANGQNNGTKEQLWSCNGKNQQYWYYIPSSYGGQYEQLENYGNDKCLDDTNGGGDGTQLQTWTCLQNQNQAWYINNIVGQVYADIVGAVIDSHGNTMVVDNANNNIQDGNKIQAWQVLGPDNAQKWCDSAVTAC